ncbi:MAG: hypothetical protein SFY56_05245 [Bacteroidota bacterium]|nr:hypothetical protein [Bacteroidota bacterium]
MANIIINPLQIYSNQLLLLFQKAKTSKNPALYLYSKNARTPLFMVESLTRILLELSANPNFEKWHKVFKKLEDSIGEIDYYDAALKNFSSNKLIEKKSLEYLLKKKNKLVDKFNKKLIEKEFYLPVFNQALLANELNLNDKLIVGEIKKHIVSQIENISEFFSQFHDSFDNMELQVHELRRKLRWISIYAQSLNGIIVLKSIKEKYEWEKEFVTPAEKKSLYNNLTVAKNLNNYIYFNNKAFYALSNIIRRLGEIKDVGLNILLLEKCIRKTHTEKIENIRQKAQEQLKSNASEQDLLNEAHKILLLFIKKYRIPEELLLK